MNKKWQIAASIKVKPKVILCYMIFSVATVNDKSNLVGLMMFLDLKDSQNGSDKRAVMGINPKILLFTIN